jgi:hypothetical protein
MSTLGPKSTIAAAEMGDALNPSIVGINTCKICRKTFSGPRALFINPTNPTATSPAAQASVDLMEHVMREHPAIDRDMQTQSAQFLGVLRLMAFTLFDKAVAKQRDYLRWYVHQSTLNAQISDAKLEKRAEQLAELALDVVDSSLLYVKAHSSGEVASDARAKLKARIAEGIAIAISELRAELQEPGKYPNGPETVLLHLEKAGISTS